MDIDKAALWAEVDSLLKIEHQQPGDLTIAEAAKRYGVTRQVVTSRLRAAVMAGHLTEHRVILDNGREGFVYRPTRTAE